MFVTHDVTEALKLGTRIMIMNQGKIQQFDTAKNILEYPANAYVASLLQSVQEGLNFSDDTFITYTTRHYDKLIQAVLEHFEIVGLTL